MKIKIDSDKTYNYKELCALMGEKVTNGGFRTRQFEKWRTEYEIDKAQGTNRYTVRKLSLTEKQDVAKRFSYQQYLEPMLYKLLVNSKHGNEYSVDYSMIDLMYDLYLVNGNYKDAKYKANQTLLCDYFLWGETELNSYTFETYKMFKKIIKDIFKSMQSRSIITITEIYTKVNKLVINNVEKITTTKMTDNEVSTMLKHRRRITLEKYNCDKYESLSYFKRQKVDEIVSEKMGISWFYTNYHIILNKCGAKEIIKNNNYEFTYLGTLVNNKTQEKINKSVQGDLRTMVRADKLSMTDTLINKNTNGYLCKKIIKGCQSCC